LRVWVLALMLVLTSVTVLGVFAPPALAETGAGQDGATAQTAVTADSGGTAGGVRPVDPGKVEAKVKELEALLYGALTPVVDILGKVSIGAAALMLVAALVIGAGVLKKAVQILLCVALGVALWANAAKIAGIIMVVGKWLGQ